MKNPAIYFSILCAILFSCSGPSNNRDANEKTRGIDTSSSEQQFNRDTTINMNSGGGTGTNQSRADSLADDGKAAGH